MPEWDELPKDSDRLFSYGDTEDRLWLGQSGYQSIRDKILSMNEESK
jgi:hypothetical protein